jgi:hypothetical protein
MHRPWTRSMPNPPESNHGQMGNNFTQGQSSQQDSDTAFSQVCHLYEQSQQQHQEMMQHLINMGNHQGQNQNRSKLSELQKTNPTVFSHTDKPLEADDWLRDIERKLVIAQCMDREKVLYTPILFFWYSSIMVGKLMSHSSQWSQYDMGTIQGKLSGSTYPQQYHETEEEGV